MGTDLFTSSRGPGLIGTLMALVVLIGFGLLYFLVFDERFQGGEQTLESIIKEQEKNLTSLRSRKSNQETKLAATAGFKKTASELRQETTRHGIIVERREKLEATLAESEEAFAALTESMAEYGSAYRKSARAAMIGREWDELKTNDGKVFAKVKVTEIDPVRMQIRHSGGITGVALDTLPDDLQDFLQVDAGEKEQLLAAEAESRVRQKQHAELGQTEHRLGQLKHELTTLNRERERVRTLEQKATDALPTLQRAIEAKRSELEREEQKAQTGGISNAPQVRAQLQTLEGKLRLAREQGPVLRAKLGKLDQQALTLEGKINETRQKLERENSKSKQPG